MRRTESLTSVGDVHGPVCKVTGLSLKDLLIVASGQLHLRNVM